FFRMFVENGADTDSRLANALFRFRSALGKLFRLDPGTGTLAIPGTACATVADRLEAPDHARDQSRDFLVPGKVSDFRPVYVFEDEALIEASNKTIHALIHLGWIDTADGRKTASLAVYVKSRGWFSDFYMALIGPFRHLVVYPAWFSRIRRRWAARGARVSERSSHPDLGSSTAATIR
ncbi:MAG: DUF2867 domain-containing protein, partial [Polyangiales bacterium]